MEIHRGRLDNEILADRAQLLAQFLLRRRRCFEIAKPRRSAGGAQLNRSLGEFEGPIRDLDLGLLATVSTFSSAESGSGEPPDRAQICAPMMPWKPV